MLRIVFRSSARASSAVAQVPETLKITLPGVGERDDYHYNLRRQTKILSDEEWDALNAKLATERAAKATHKAHFGNDRTTMYTSN